jgi:hypothetical protein
MRIPHCGVCGIIVIMMFSSCGSDGKSISQKAGEVIGESATDFGKGVSEKVDVSTAVNVELNKTVTDLDVSMTVAKTNFFDKSPEKTPHSKTILLYLLSKNEISERTFKMIACDASGAEIGRSKLKISFVKDDAKYVEFTFDDRVDFALAKKYVLSSD